MSDYQDDVDVIDGGTGYGPEEPSGGEPEGVGELDLGGSDGLGPGSPVDSDGDGRTDSLVWEAGDWTIVGTDMDGDGKVDELTLMQDGASAMVFDRSGDRVTGTGVQGGEIGGSYSMTADQFAQQMPELAPLLDGVQLDGGGAGAAGGEDGTPDTGGAATPGDPGEPTGQEYPTVNESGQIIGDPAEYRDDWFDQAFDGSCVPSSIAVIASSYTGQHFTDKDFIGRVNTVGAWQVDENGKPSMTADGAAEVLNSVGIPAESTYGDLSLLEQKIGAGDGVMVAVDGNEIWNGGEGGPDDAGAANHMVVVSSIDPDAGTVTLNDSGTPDGNEETVPLSVFMDAWQTSNCQMVSCDQSVDQWQAAQEGGAPAQADPQDGQPAADPDQQTPDQQTPDQQAPADQTPVEQSPDQTPVQQSPVQQSPVQQTPEAGTTPGGVAGDGGLDVDHVVEAAREQPGENPLTALGETVAKHHWVLLPVTLGAAAVIRSAVRRR